MSIFSKKLNVIEISISGKQLKIKCAPKGREDETELVTEYDYKLSENVKINIDESIKNV